MAFMDLPLVLAETICLEAFHSQDLHDLCEMRKVNRFFEEMATTVIARKYLCNMSIRESKAVPDSYRQRLIDGLLGEFDRRSNHLASYFHKVADYLTEHSTDPPPSHSCENTRSEWVRAICHALNQCHFRTHDGIHPLREHPRDSPDDSSIRASAFMILLITGKVDIETSISSKEYSLTDTCPYLGAPLQMLCCLGHADTVRRLIRLGAKDYNDKFWGPKCLTVAARGNHTDVVNILLDERSHQNYDWLCIEDAVLNAVKSKSRQGVTAIVNGYVRDGQLPGRAGYGWPIKTVRLIAYNGWDDMLGKIIEAGVGTRDEARSGESILRRAVEGGHLSTCKLLHSYGLSKQTEPQISTEFFDLAAKSGNVEVFRFVAQSKIAREEACDKGYIFLLAAGRGHEAMLEYAIAQGYHLEHKHASRLQSYALLRAISHGGPATTEMLVRRLSLDPSAGVVLQKTGLIITPIQAAVGSGNVETVRLLLRLGANPEASQIGALGFTTADLETRALAIIREMGTFSLKHLGFPWYGSDFHLRKVEAARRVILKLNV